MGMLESFPPFFQTNNAYSERNQMQRTVQLWLLCANLVNVAFGIGGGLCPLRQSNFSLNSFIVDKKKYNSIRNTLN